MTRDWAEARRKVETEGCCRWCGRPGAIEAAHIIPRSRVRPGPGEDARNIVPLCRDHHALFDSNRLDLLPVLTLEEQAYAVSLFGTYEALIRMSGQRWETVA